mmetsp:Transcript_5376/g.18040  ORF Transcript_5376/g.18040 Transcript_5376/m.18040 type:complete len:553 (+) Transcript_5376:68-1726(+)
MGACSSKNEEPHRDGDTAPSRGLRRGRSKGNFNTDLRDKNETTKTFSEVLVRKNQLPVWEVYDLSQGVELGRGACGMVQVVKKISSGELFAMKTVSLDNMGGETMEELRQEIEVQRSLDHPNIVKLHEWFEEKRRNQLHIVMELCSGGALVSRMKRHRHGYGEAAARKLVEKMLSATLYCHQRGVVHRDIKLDNFIYEHEGDDAELKMIDFGFAHESYGGGDGGMREQIGTPSYMAPELWADHEVEYDSSVDLWAMGVVTYMLLSGKRPFHHQDRAVKARMIRETPVPFSGAEWDHVSHEGIDFITALLQKDPKQRISASEALKHPWFTCAPKEVDAGEAEERNAAVLASLESFARADDIKKVALEVIAFATPSNVLAELRKTFQNIDTDKSGTISPAEFKEAMGFTLRSARESGGEGDDIASKHIDALFRHADINASGELDYTEFLGAGLCQTRHVTKPSMMSAFAILDCNGDGFISKLELRATLGEDYEEAELEEMIASCGGENSCITFEQFKAMMLKDMKVFSSTNRKWASSGNLSALSTSQKAKSAKA